MVATPSGTSGPEWDPTLATLVPRRSLRRNVSLAAASGGSPKALVEAAGNVFALGPIGMRLYLRDSRLCERVVPRLRARMMGAY